MAGNGRDQYSHRGVARQDEDSGRMTSSGYPRRSGYVHNDNEDDFQYESAAPRPGVERNTSTSNQQSNRGVPRQFGYWHGNAAPQAGDQQDIRSLGHPRRNAAPQYVSDHSYPPQGALPQVGHHGDVPSFGHPRQNAAPQQGNDNSPMKQRSTAQLLAQFGKWQEFQKIQEDGRAMILRNLSEHSQELGKRGVVSKDLSRMLDILAQDYQRLDHSLSRVTAEGFRDSGLRAAYPPNGGSNRGTAENVVASNANRPAPAAAGNAGVPANPMIRKPRANHQDKSLYHLQCIICGQAFRDHRALYTHFPVCVQQRGNVNGNRWFDHDSVEIDKIPATLIRK